MLCKLLFLRTVPRIKLTKHINKVTTGFLFITCVMATHYGANLFRKNLSFFFGFLFLGILFGMPIWLSFIFQNCSDSVFISSKTSASQFSFSNSLYITTFQISTQWVSMDSQRTSCVLNIVSKSSSKSLMLIECRSRMQIFCMKELLKFSINAHLVTYHAHISSSSSFVL